MKSLTFLMALLLSVVGCTKNGPEAIKEVQREPSSKIEQAEPVNKDKTIYLPPSDDRGLRCKDTYGATTC